MYPPYQPVVGDRVKVVTENVARAEILDASLATRPVLVVEKQMPEGDWQISDSRIVSAHHLHLVERP
jgi:hypothetical protein